MPAEQPLAHHIPQRQTPAKSVKMEEIIHRRHRNLKRISITKKQQNVYHLSNDTDLVFHCNRVPGHVNALDWAEGGKGLSDGVFTKLIVYGANIHPTHDG